VIEKLVEKMKERAVAASDRMIRWQRYELQKQAAIDVLSELATRYNDRARRVGADINREALLEDLRDMLAELKKEPRGAGSGSARRGSRRRRVSPRPSRGAPLNEQSRHGRG
jgi:hypothetical protein